MAVITSASVNIVQMEVADKSDLDALETEVWEKTASIEDEQKTMRADYTARISKSAAQVKSEVEQAYSKKTDTQSVESRLSSQIKQQSDSITAKVEDYGSIMAANAVRLVPDPSCRSNRLADPDSAVQDVTGFGGEGQPPAIEGWASCAKIVARSMRIAAAAAATGARTYRLECWACPVPGEKYKLSAGLVGYDAAGKAVYRNTAETPPDGSGWRAVTGTVQMPAEVRSVHAFLQVNNAEKRPDGTVDYTAPVTGWWATGWQATDVTDVAEQARADQLSYATKSEVKVERDRITAEVSRATTAEGAAQTAATKAQQTADGLKAQVTQATQTASDALSKASAAQQTADGFRQEVSEDYLSKADASKTYAAQSSLEQTAEGITAKVTEARKVADAAQTAAASAQVTADGVKTQVEKAQQTADGAVAKASAAQQTADGLSSKVAANAQTASDALAKASAAQQTADGFKQEVSEDYLSKADASKTYAAQSSLEQTADKIRAEVKSSYVDKETGAALATKSEVSQTKSEILSQVGRDYVDKATGATLAEKSYVDQTAAGIRSEASSTYQPKSGMSSYAEKSYVDQKAGSITTSVEAVGQSVADLSAIATKSYRLVKSATERGLDWIKVGTLKSAGDSRSVLIDVQTGSGYNGQASQNSRISILVKDGYQDSDKKGPEKAFGVSVLRENCQKALVRVMASAADVCDVWLYLPWQYANSQYTLAGFYSSWTPGAAGPQAGEPTEGVAQDVAYRLNTEQLAADAAATYTTKSELKQATDSITATVSKKLDSDAAAATYARQTELRQTAESITASVRTAQAGADAAKAAADGKVAQGSSGVSSLETVMALDSGGLSIFKKVSGKVASFMAKVTGAAYQICDAAGNVLAEFAADAVKFKRGGKVVASFSPDGVELGDGDQSLASFTADRFSLLRRRGAATIDMCNGGALLTGTSGSSPEGGDGTLEIKALYGITLDASQPGASSAGVRVKQPRSGAASAYISGADPYGPLAVVCPVELWSGSLREGSATLSSGYYMALDIVFSDGKRTYSQRVYPANGGAMGPDGGFSTSISREVYGGGQLYIATSTVTVEGWTKLTLSGQGQAILSNGASPVVNVAEKPQWLEVKSVIGWC